MENPLEQRVVLKTAGQDPLRRDQEPGPWPESSLEANLPSDLAAEFPAPLLGDPAGQGTGGYPARLEQDQRPGADQRGRDPGRLSRPGWSDDHQGATSVDFPVDPGQMGIDGQRLHGARV